MQRFRALTLGERIAAGSGLHRDPVRLGGVPVLPMPEHVVEAAAAAARAPRPRESRGVPALRAAIARDLQQNLGLAVDPDREVVVTHGAQHGLSVALRAVLTSVERDRPEVLVPVPTYFFDGTIELAGAHPRHVPTRPEDGWRLDLEAMEAAVTPATVAIAFCNPTNPTGIASTEEELVALVALAHRHGLVVIADESYAHRLYSHDAPGYVPIRRVAGADPDVITVTSLSKDFAFTNWRVGHVHGAGHVVDRIQHALEWDAVNVGDVVQEAARAAIEGPREWLDPAYEPFGANRDHLVALLGEVGIPAVRPAAGIYLLADLGDAGVEGEELELLLGGHGVHALAGDAFGGPGTWARLLYGGARSELDRLVERLAGIVRA